MKISSLPLTLPSTCSFHCFIVGLRRTVSNCYYTQLAKQVDVVRQNFGSSTCVRLSTKIVCLVRRTWRFVLIDFLSASSCCFSSAISHPFEQQPGFSICVRTANYRRVTTPVIMGDGSVVRTGKILQAPNTWFYLWGKSIILRHSPVILACRVSTNWCHSSWMLRAQIWPYIVYDTLAAALVWMKSSVLPVLTCGVEIFRERL